MREDIVILLYQFWSQTRFHSEMMVSSLYWRLAQRLAVSSWQELMRVKLLKVVQENSVLRPAKVYWRTWRGWYILRRQSMRPYLTQLTVRTITTTQTTHFLCWLPDSPIWRNTLSISISLSSNTC